MTVDVEVFFRGVRPEPSLVSLLGGQRVSEVVRVYSPLGPSFYACILLLVWQSSYHLLPSLASQEIAPSAKLDRWLQVVRPVRLGKINALGERDTMLDGSPLYQLVLEYEVEQAEAGEVTCQWSALQVKAGGYRYKIYQTYH